MTGPFVPIGRVARAHGLKGELSMIEADGVSLDDFIGVSVWFVPPPATARHGVLRSVRSGPKGPLVTIEGITGPEEAQALSGRSIVVDQDEYERHYDPPFDPRGIVVIDEERGHLGVVEDEILTGANDVWVVRGPLGEVLIPVIDDVLLDFDEVERVATIRLLPGLLPE